MEIKEEADAPGFHDVSRDAFQPNRKIWPRAFVRPSSGRVSSGATNRRMRQRMTTGMVTMRMTSLTIHQAMRSGLKRILKNVFMIESDRNVRRRGRRSQTEGRARCAASAPLPLARDQLVEFLEEQSDHPDDGFEFDAHDGLRWK